MAIEATFSEPGMDEFSVSKRRYDFCMTCSLEILAVMDPVIGKELWSVYRGG